MADAAVPCEWCGRAIRLDPGGWWEAVKGVERGYPPFDCDASDDGSHSPAESRPCGCCPYCGALPGHQNPPAGEVWQHQHAPIRDRSQPADARVADASGSLEPGAESAE